MMPHKSPKRKTPARAWKRALRREMAAAGKVLVLGIGNPDKADDGAGILAAKELMKALGGRARGRQVRASGACSSALPGGVKILLGYETPENLTGKIRAFSPGLVIMMDAVIGPHPVGMIFPVPPEDIPDEGVSTHKISLRMLVTYLEATVGCRVRFLGIQAGRIEMGRAMTPVVKKSARALARWLGEALDRRIRRSSGA